MKPVKRRFSSIALATYANCSGGRFVCSESVKQEQFSEDPAFSPQIVASWSLPIGASLQADTENVPSIKTRDATSETGRFINTPCVLRF